MSLDGQKGERLTEEAGAKAPQLPATLRRLGRFAAITPPAVNLLLSAVSKPAAAVTSGAPFSSRQLKEPVSVATLRRAA